MEYFERIKNLRIDADKTQQEIADLLQTGQSYYAKYENGHRPLPIDRLRDLCIYYNVSADFILGLPEGMPYGHSKTRKLIKHKVIVKDGKFIREDELEKEKK